MLLPQRASKLARLKKRQTIIGDPDDLDKIGFEGAWQPDSF